MWEFFFSEKLKIEVDAWRHSLISLSLSSSSSIELKWLPPPISPTMQHLTAFCLPSVLPLACLIAVFKGYLIAVLSPNLYLTQKAERPSEVLPSPTTILALP